MSRPVQYRPLLTSLACGVVVLISFVALAVPAKAAFPGGNGKIVFARDGEIYTMNVNGTGRTQLTGNKGQDFDPAWSPDGTKVVFARNEDIYVMNADGSGQTNLTNGQANNHDAAWSPDGTKIVFTSLATSPEVGVYTMNADGSGKTLLSSGGYGSESQDPAWSPDGTKIAFERDGEIYTINVNGTGLANLTNSGPNPGDGCPAWSPDGTTIAFCTDRDSSCFSCNFESEIYVMAANGTGQTRVTHKTGVRNVQPAWAPDGTKIAFASCHPNCDIYKMNPDGTGQTNLTHSGASVGNGGPDWQPLTPGVGELLTGKNLLLTWSPVEAAARRFNVESTDRAMTLGAGNGSADDPTIGGGSVRVVGGGFDDTYTLPAQHWTYISKPGTGKGYRYKDAKLLAGPITAAIVEPGRLVKADGSGSGLGHSLGSDPNPVDVVLTTGLKRYCMSFGGITTFVMNKQYTAKRAPAPGTCPP